jgi:F0F1-type ATP synthase membrane subunit b/b'
MTIQINILIWTVICFCAFMLILWRLLLKPMLAFMDARKARIAHAHSLDRSAERAEKQALLEAQRLAEVQRQAEERKQIVLALREKSRIEREERERRFLQETQARRADVEAEANDLVPQLAVSLQEHVNTFTDKLIAFGER